MSDLGRNVFIVVAVICLVAVLGLVVGNAITGSFAGCETQEPYTKEECGNVRVPYEKEECSDVKVPYESFKTIYVQEAYLANVPIEYLNKGTVYGNYFWTYNCGVTTTVENTDSVGGYFRVNFDVTTTAGNYKSLSNTVYIAPGGVRGFWKEFRGDYKFSNNDILPPDKEITKYRDVPKKIPTTDYRTETRCETVTKYRTKYQCKTVTKYRTVRSWATCFE